LFSGFRFISCHVFSLVTLGSLKSPVFVSQLHPISNHLPTVFSFQVSLSSGQKSSPHLMLQVWLELLNFFKEKPVHTLQTDTTYILEKARRVSRAALAEFFGLGSARVAAGGASSLVPPEPQSPPSPQSPVSSSPQSPVLLSQPPGPAFRTPPSHPGLGMSGSHPSRGGLWPSPEGARSGSPLSTSLPEGARSGSPLSTSSPVGARAGSLLSSPSPVGARAGSPLPAAALEGVLSNKRLPGRPMSGRLPDKLRP